MLDKSRVGSKSGRDDASDVEAIRVAILGNIASYYRQGIAQKFERTDQGFEAWNGGNWIVHGIYVLCHKSTKAQRNAAALCAFVN